MRGPDAPCLLCPCCKHHVDDLTQTLAGDWLCGPCAEETDAELRELEDRDAADALSAFVRADTLPPAAPVGDEGNLFAASLATSRVAA